MSFFNTSFRLGIAALSLSLLTSTSAFSGGHMGDKDHTMPSKDVVETAISAGNFEGPFTVFAPTDEAFAMLPAGTVEMLLMPANKQKLIDILTYHVVAGDVKAADVIKLSSAETLNGPGEFRKTMFITGSAKPYITTVGLFNDKGQMLAVGKLAEPLENRDDIDMNIIVRWDY